MFRSNKKKGSKKNKEGEQPSVDVDLELRKLRRVIYLSEVAPVYLAGNPEFFFLRKYATNLSFISDIMKNLECPDKFLDIVKEANNDPKLPRRVTLFYVLAYALRNHPPKNEFTGQLSDLVLVVCKTDEEFFKFISIFTVMKGQGRDRLEHELYNKITTSVSRIIRKFLEKKTPLEYARAVASNKGYHGWQYKDLIKLSHYKSETAGKVLVTEYVLKKFKSLTEPEIEEMKGIFKILEDWTTLRHSENNVEEVCKLIVDLGANYRDINSKLLKKQEVWCALIPHLSPQEVLLLLPKLQKLNMFEPAETSMVLAKVKEALSAEKMLGKVQPLEAFIHLKNFQKGGKPLDPKLEHFLKTNKLPIKTPPEITEPNSIMGLIRECWKHSYPLDSIKLGMNKKVMLLLDAQQCDTACFKQKNVSCLEAEVALAHFILNTEKNPEITVCNGQEIEAFDFDKSFESFDANVLKLKSLTPSKIDLLSMFDWAVEKKKEVDVFVVIFQNTSSLRSNANIRKQFKEAYAKYASKTNAEVKIVLICLGQHNMASLPESANTLTLCGFGPELPNVIHSFVKQDVHNVKGKQDD